MRICKSVSHCSLRLGILRKNLSYLHINQHPLWLHISFFTYFNQPLTNHNIAAVTRVWYKKSSHTVRMIPQRPSLRSNSILFCLLSEQIKNDLITKFDLIMWPPWIIVWSNVISGQLCKIIMSEALSIVIYQYIFYFCSCSRLNESRKLGWNRLVSVMWISHHLKQCQILTQVFPNSFFLRKIQKEEKRFVEMLAFVSEVNCNCFCVFTNGLLSKMLQSWQDNLIYILWRMLDKACFILVFIL